MELYIFSNNELVCADSEQLASNIIISIGCPKCTINQDKLGRVSFNFDGNVCVIWVKGNDGDITLNILPQSFFEGDKHG